MIEAGESLIFDADVHCAPMSAEALFPYLPDQWVEHLRNTGFSQPTAIQGSYPGWMDMLATEPSGLTEESLRRNVLEKVSAALLHCYWGVESFSHPYLGPAIATAVNRWLEERWLGRHAAFLAAAVVTPQHVDAAVSEIERIAQDPRFAAIYVPARAPAPYGSQGYWPIWEAAAGHGLAIAIGPGGAQGTQPTPIGWLSSFWEEHVVGALPLHSHIASFAFSGLLDRYPDLRIVFHESGVSWLPALSWRMDHEWQAAHREVPWMDGPPSSYVRRFMRFTTAPFDLPPDRQQLCQIIEMSQLDQLLLYATDYPHRYGNGNETLLNALTDEQQRRTLWDNANDTYRLDARLPASVAR